MPLSSYTSWSSNTSDALENVEEESEAVIISSPKVSKNSFHKSYSTSCMQPGSKCHAHGSGPVPRNGAMHSRAASPVRLIKIQSSSQLQEEYQLGGRLGEGAFGSVLLATHKQDGTKWAIKKMAKDKDAKNTYGKSWENEIRIFRIYRHPHIVQVREIFESDNHCYLIMEYCEATLDAELKKRGTFHEEDARCKMRQLGSALKYLHANKIVHRDLKLQNILLRKNLGGCVGKAHSHNGSSGKSSAGSGRSVSSDSSVTEFCPFTVKLTDFGLSIVVRGNDHQLADNVGTPIYQSPEIVQGKSYSQQCDVWSFGMCLYILLHGRDPYQQATTDHELYEAIKSYNYRESCKHCSICAKLSKPCVSVLSKLLDPVPASRFFMGEFMNVPWVSENGDVTQQFNVLDLMKQVNTESSRHFSPPLQRHSPAANTSPLTLRASDKINSSSKKVTETKPTTVIKPKAAKGKV